MPTLASWVFLLACSGCWAVITTASSHDLTLTGPAWMPIVAVIRVTTLVVLRQVPQPWYLELRLFTRMVVALICTVALSVLGMTSLGLAYGNGLVVGIVLLLMSARRGLRVGSGTISATLCRLLLVWTCTMVVHTSCRWGLAFAAFCSISDAWALAWDADTMGNLVARCASQVGELY